MGSFRCQFSSIRFSSVRLDGGSRFPGVVEVIFPPIKANGTSARDTWAAWRNSATMRGALNAQYENTIRKLNKEIQMEIIEREKR